MVGVLDVCDKLKEVIRFRHGVQRDLSPAAYMSVLRTGRLKLYGKDHDVSDLVTQAISKVAGQVLRAAQRLIAGDGYDLSAILLVGGGAAEIGRASCWERVGQYVSHSVGPVALKKKY